MRLYDFDGALGSGDKENYPVSTTKPRTGGAVKMRWCLFGLLLFMVVLGWAPDSRARQWNGEPVTVNAVNVEVDDPFANGFDWSGLARALIGLHPGDTLTGAGLDKAVKALDPLARVRTHVVVSPQGAVVTFSLQPYKRIKSIAIDGGKSLGVPPPP